MFHTAFKEVTIKVSLQKTPENFVVLEIIASVPNLFHRNLDYKLKHGKSSIQGYKQATGAKPPA